MGLAAGTGGDGLGNSHTGLSKRAAPRGGGVRRVLTEGVWGESVKEVSEGRQTVFP